MELFMEMGWRAAQRQCVCVCDGVYVCVHTRTLALADVGVPHASILLIVISLSSSLSHLLIMKFALITLLCY